MQRNTDALFLVAHNTGIQIDGDGTRSRAFELLVLLSFPVGTQLFHAMETSGPTGTPCASTSYSK